MSLFKYFLCFVDNNVGANECYQIRLQAVRQTTREGDYYIDHTMHTNNDTVYYVYWIMFFTIIQFILFSVNDKTWWTIIVMSYLLACLWILYSVVRFIFSCRSCIVLIYEILWIALKRKVETANCQSLYVAHVCAGTDHDSVRGHLLVSHGRARVPLFAQNLHHHLPAGEER